MSGSLNTHFKIRNSAQAFEIVTEPEHFTECLKARTQTLTRALYIMNLFYVLLIGGLYTLNGLYSLEITFFQIITYVAIISFVTHISYFFTQTEILTSLWRADPKLVKITPYIFQINHWYLPLSMLEDLTFSKDLMGPHISITYRVPSLGVETTTLYCRNILGLSDPEDIEWVVNQIKQYLATLHSEITQLESISALESDHLPLQKTFTLKDVNHQLRFMYSQRISLWYETSILVGCGLILLLMMNIYTWSEFALGACLSFVLLVFLAETLPNAYAFLEKVKDWVDYLEQQVNHFFSMSGGLKCVILGRVDKV